MTWAFVLQETEDRGTRLIVRARAGPEYEFRELPWWLGKRLVRIVHFLMQRKQLLSIATRAESVSARKAAGSENSDTNSSGNSGTTGRGRRR